MMVLNLGVPDPVDDGLNLPAALDRRRGLHRYETARRALAEAHGIDEIKDIRDKAEAMRLYARQAQDTELQRMAAEIKIRAERRAGELLAAMDKHPPGPAAVDRSQRAGDPVKLKDIGISHSQSSRWQAEASMPEAEFEAWLAGHKGDRMPSSSGLRNLIKIEAAKQRNAAESGCTIHDLEALAFERPNAFAAILVDVPWKYENYSEAGGGRAPDLHYATMTLEEIVGMGPIVRALAAPDCALFFWTSGPHLGNQLSIVYEWSIRDDEVSGYPIFRYSTKAFCWVKQNPSGDGWARGNGHWTAANTEDCLLFLKGHPLRLDKGIDQLVIAPRGAHSAKPPEVAARIERLVGGPYLELFAREARAGWTVWGNQVSPEETAKGEPT